MKLKRSLSIFLTLLFTLVTVAGVAPAAHARACNHDFDVDTVTVYTTRNSSGHAWIVKEQKTCRICGYYTENPLSTGSGPHSNEVYDDGHGMNNRHSYHTECTECHWVGNNITVVCYGPPCISPYSLEPIYEPQ